MDMVMDMGTRKRKNGTEKGTEGINFINRISAL